MKRAYHQLLLAGMMALQSSCSMMALKDDLDTGSQSGVAVVRVKNASAKTPIVFYLYKTVNDEVSLVEHRVTTNTVPLTLINLTDTYASFVFEDSNRDGNWQSSEPVSQEALSWTPVVERKTEKEHRTVDDFNVTSVQLNKLSANDAERVKGLVVKLEQQRAKFPERFLQQAQLSDAAFNDESIQLGAWQPITFMSKVGYGLYVLEPYQKHKIPVLFVHGINDSPKTFSKTIEALDAERYQAVFYHYPGSMALEYTAYQLAQFVSRLCVQQGGLTMPMVSHSMGGLVTRRMQQMLDQTDCKITVPWWLTIATPFGGHEGARWGVETSPVVAPVWFDMTPGSGFLTTLEHKPVLTIPHHMVVSYGGAGGFSSGSNDGVVTVASQLADYIYDEAVSLTMVNENHMDVLVAKRTLNKLQELQGVPSTTAKK